MPSGIFGPRAPSYPLPSYSSRVATRFQPYSTYSSYPPSTSNLPAYIRPTYSQTVYNQPAYSQPAFPQQYTTASQAYYNYPYQSLPASSYPGSLPYNPSSIYLPASQFQEGISSRGLEAILVAILVLVSLDLIIVRPMKGYSGCSGN